MKTKREHFVLPIIRFCLSPILIPIGNYLVHRKTLEVISATIFYNDDTALKEYCIDTINYYVLSFNWRKRFSHKWFKNSVTRKAEWMLLHIRKRKPEMTSEQFFKMINLTDKLK